MTTYNIIIGVSITQYHIVDWSTKSIRQNEQLEDRVVGTVISIRDRVSTSSKEMRRLQREH